MDIFPHLFVVKNVMFVWKERDVTGYHLIKSLIQRIFRILKFKNENKLKRGRDGQFKKLKVSMYRKRNLT